jgi:hypothetical protein
VARTSLRHVVWQWQQLDPARAMRGTRAAFGGAAWPLEPAAFERGLHAPNVEAQRALRAIADTDATEFRCVVANPVAADVQHPRHGGRVDVEAETRLVPE